MANVINTVAGITFQAATRSKDASYGTVISDFALPYLSISVSLNVLLTLMIVIRLILYTRKIRTAVGIAGIGGLSKAIATMLIESCALYTMGSLLVIVPWIAGYTNAVTFVPFLSQIQVRAFPGPRFSGRLSDLATDLEGHRSAAHHSTSCQQERADKKHRRLRASQLVQNQDQRGDNGQWWYSS